MSGAGFCRAERILSRKDYVKISFDSKKAVSRYFVLLCAYNNSQTSRLGITVSRKVGNSVCRNRLKRHIREFYRQNKELFIQADYIFIARPGADNLVYSELCQELVNAVHKVGKQLCS